MLNPFPLRLSSFAESTSGSIKDRLGHVLNLSGVPEQATHESIGRIEAGFRLEPEGFRDTGLMLQEESVAPLSGLEVQGAPQSDQELFCFLHRLALPRPQQRGVFDVVLRVNDFHRAADPADRVDVTKASRAFLEVGLQQLGAGPSLGQADGSRLSKPLKEACRITAK